MYTDTCMKIIWSYVNLKKRQSQQTSSAFSSAEMFQMSHGQIM